MIEIYAECKSAIINNKCSECNEFYSCYICDFVEERYQQGRADAIEECKYKIVDSLEKQLGCKVCSGYEEKNHCSKCKMQEIINLTVDILEQLKEQK